ncbi:DUF6705 family protein [Psychroserpens mesophilus]|uniref:DUF6705 family protein n=1 Tax=Psychroserpens mesophilus TaxID=325473 RepID=UPI003D660101
MKNIIYKILIVLIFPTLSCIAQNPVVAIDASISETVDGAYFKDLNNEFNKFVGTWKFTNGNETLTIALKKGLMIYNGKDYQDELLGEYKYEISGLTVVNTLPNIDNTNPAKHNIRGNLIISHNQSINCDDCSENEKRVELYFRDSERLYLTSHIILRYLENENNSEKLTATIYQYSSTILPYANAPTVTRVPYDTYTMEKQ